MNPKLGLRNRELMAACLIVGPVTLLAPHKSVAGNPPTIRFFPIRTAALGSPVGTVGDPVTPTFNEVLDCWELKVSGGVEVDIDVQAFGWGDSAGSPGLGAIQATVVPAGYDNGVGAPLNPKGWPGSPGDGAYQATKVCRLGDLSPCTPPFDPFCTAGGGFCVHNLDWVMPPCAHDFPAFITHTLAYAWATAAQEACVVDDGEVKTMGGLILEVPPDAAGTYVIAVNPDPNSSVMNPGGGNPIPGVQFISACITVIGGACCVDTDSDGHRDTCHDDGFESECVAADGLYMGDAVACIGIVGACCLDGDGDGFDETCREMDSDCCDAQGGSFPGSGVACAGVAGACCLDGDGDGFDDTCRVMDRLCCDTQGGSFHGAGTTCDNSRGACTLDSDGDGFQDTCRVMDQTCCDERDGTFRGAGSECSALLGACCLDFDHVCVEIDLTNCVEQNGRYQGLNTACRGDEDGDGSDDACGEIIPAVSEWGLIILALLLLVGVKIIAARRRLIAAPCNDQPV